MFNAAWCTLNVVIHGKVMGCQLVTIESFRFKSNALWIMDLSILMIVCLSNLVFLFFPMILVTLLTLLETWIYIITTSYNKAKAMRRVIYLSLKFWYWNCLFVQVCHVLQWVGPIWPRFDSFTWLILHNMIKENLKSLMNLRK